MFYSAFIHIIHYTVLSFWDKSDADYTIHKRDVYELYSQKKKSKIKIHTHPQPPYERIILSNTWYYLCLIFYLAIFFLARKLPQQQKCSKRNMHKQCKRSLIQKWIIYSHQSANRIDINIHMIFKKHYCMLFHSKLHLNGKVTYLGSEAEKNCHVGLSWFYEHITVSIWYTESKLTLIS